MEKKQRIICFNLNAIAIFLIVVIAYINYKMYIYFLKTSDGSPLYFWYFAYLTSIFLCSILLQGEHILTIIHRRKSLLIRWEQILLGIMAILLAPVNFWFELEFLFPRSPERSYALFKTLVHGIFMNPSWSVICIMAAGVFFVRAFHVQDILIDKRERGVRFIWSILTIIFIMVIVCLNHVLWHLMDNPDSLSNFYIRYFLNLISAFVCPLLLSGENISNIIRRRKSLLIRWELVILGIVAILLALMKIWIILISHNFISLDGFNAAFIPAINYIISFYEFWVNALMFASGILFVRAFHIKIDQIKDDKINENVSDEALL